MSAPKIGPASPSGYAAADDYSDGDRSPMAQADKTAFAAITEGMDRGAFIDSLKQRRDKIRHCRSVPFSVLFYVLFIADIVLHGGVKPAFEVEQTFRDALGAGGTYPFPDGLTRPKDWYAYVTGTFLPTMLPDSDPDGVPYPAWARGRFQGEGTSLLIGGIRLATTRRKSVGCKLPGDLNALYGGNCHADGEGGYDLTPYGNVTAAAAAGVAGAFVPSTVEDDATGAQFQLFLDQRLPTDPTLIDAINGLKAGGWLDNATSEVRIQSVFLNGETGSVIRMSIGAEFGIGGRVSTYLDVDSIFLDPYYGTLAGLVIALDLIMLGYWLYLLAGTCRRIGKALCGPGGSRRPRRGAGCCAWTRYRLGRLASYWYLLDIATVASMLASFVMWLLLVSLLNKVKNEAVSAASGDKVPSVLEQDIVNAVATMNQAKNAAVVTLGLLTLRLFKYFRYQPRLAVISESISRGFVDALHFGLLLAVLIVFYATWGHFMFGSVSIRWTDPVGSYFSIAQFSMYDYDWDAMVTAYPGSAQAFYVTFMFLMTNLMLWMFFAIFFDAYTLVRNEANERGPSAFSELAEVLLSGDIVGGGGCGRGACCGDWAPRYCSEPCGCCRRGDGDEATAAYSTSGGYATSGGLSREDTSVYKGLMRSASGMPGGGSTASASSSSRNSSAMHAATAAAAAGLPMPPQSLLAQALFEVRSGTLRTSDRITVDALASALSIPEHQAARVLIDMAAVKTGARGRTASE